MSKVTSIKKKSVFKVGDCVVYPTHGVGIIKAEETQKIGDHELTLLVIHFEKDKMTLRVPVNRAEAAGLRQLCGKEEITTAMEILTSRSKTAKGMWSRRAQEYEGKINSGDLKAIAEVIRDLHKNVSHPDRSYSERVIYESAVDRLASEFSAAYGVDKKAAVSAITGTMEAKAEERKEKELRQEAA